MVQWLRLSASNAGGMGLIPVGEIIPCMHMPHGSTKNTEHVEDKNRLQRSKNSVILG